MTEGTVPLHESMANISVLHVDDEPSFAEMAATFVERENGKITIETATSVEEGMERLATRQFDCIVSDYDMPGWNGIGFLEAVREKYPTLPFILFTGKGSEEIASEAISAGVTDYLQKETGTDQYAVLANRIQNVAEREHARTERRRQLDAIETAREGISILDENKRFIYVNQAYADLYGYEPDDLVGERWDLLYRDRDAKRLREEVFPLVETDGYWHGETVGLRSDGITFHEDQVLSLSGDGEIVCTVRDATDRITRKQELEQATARLEALFEQSPDMINTHDADGTILDANERFCEVLGWSKDAVVGKKVWEIDSTINRDDLRTKLARTAVGERFKFVTKYRREDGSAIPVEGHVVRLGIEGDDRFMVISRDITGRKERERELESANALLSTLFETLPVGMLAENSSRNVLAINQQMFDLFDIAKTSKAIVDEDCKRLTTSVSDQFVDPDGFVERIDELVETRNRIDDEELALRDGRTYARSYCPVELPDGGGHLWVYRDVTDRKERERQLEALNETTRELMAAESRETIAGIGVDAARHILDLEANAVHLYDESTEGLAPVAVTDALEDLVGRPPTFTGQESIAWRVYQEGEPLMVDDVSDDPDIYNPETEVRSELYFPLDGYGILIAGSPSVKAFDQQDLVLGEILTSNIVTALEQVEHTEQLRSRKRELIHQNERLEEFASVVSHDLRNPLNVAEGRLELARVQGDIDHFEEVTNALDRMNTLIDDLLTLAQKGKQVNETEPIDLETHARNCWQNVATTNATLETDIEWTVRADRTRLEQLMENLYRNAIEHGGDDVTVTVGERPDGFYVEDDGPGIDVDARTKAFEAGYSSTDGGTGFGLSIVKQIADAHGWDVDITDGTDGGTRFEISNVEFEQ